MCANGKGDMLKLFVVTHKKVTSLPQGRTLIGVGQNSGECGAPFTDATGQNIADKNSSFCELTALYWIWKNCDAEYVGLEHYRRFFCKKRFLAFFRRSKALEREEILKKLEGHEILLPRKVRLLKSVYRNYSAAHFKQDLDLCLDIIKSDHPEYAGDCERVMKGHTASMYNMFVMRKKDMDEYCEWLFDILFKAEEKIDLKNRNKYQCRVFGFLSERLFNVWLCHRGLIACYAPVYDREQIPFLKKAKGAMRRLSGSMKRNKYGKV